MKTKVHALAGLLSFLCIASFWSATLVSELFLSYEAVAAVKAGIVYAFVLFIPCMIATGGTGFAMGGQGQHPQLVAKRQRMPFVALNGLLILIPSALFLNAKAGAGAFDSGFYGVQVLELLAGALNLFLMGLNIRDGMRLTGRLSRCEG
ncbi:hypothetical protein HW932_18520 [Allochromatium humboldtianum]|uniref:Transmembrane protein n=1 Tax=Allochromatium humboldtianum TaxID=504901 RepID=A0A850RD30_9GAMM|nr:hypothetical protein [Allochromatium humboldtianum]NVZ11248.1 hypothetical protein [Allochromatium humboldtianum]